MLAEIKDILSVSAYLESSVKSRWAPILAFGYSERVSQHKAINVPAPIVKVSEGIFKSIQAASVLYPLTLKFIYYFARYRGVSSYISPQFDKASLTLVRKLVHLEILHY